jgi:cell division septation protein DedD
VTTSDERFHEFHLDGKQMVFLFISSVVVAVVIFLCGVMVGRGVHATLGGGSTEASAAAILDPTAPSEPLPSSDANLRDSSGTAPPEDLTYTTRLQSASPPPDILREPAAPAPEPVPTEPPVPARDAAVAPGLREPAGNGYVVQVMSVTKLAEAESVARGLKSKGYRAFVSPTPEGGRFFRVRVGKYPDLREAQAVAARLEKEEKFKKPWVPR